MARNLRTAVSVVCVSVGFAAGEGTGWLGAARGDDCPPVLSLAGVYDSGVMPVFAALGDVNQDGRLDLVVINFEETILTVLLQRPDGEFLPECERCNEVELYTATGALGDLNGDGFPELVTVHGGVIDEYRGWVEVHWNAGIALQTFTRGPVFESSNPRNVVLSDVDGDADLDMVISNGWYPFLPTGVDVVINNGDGTFAPAVTYDSTPDPVFVDVGDLDADGDPDIVSLQYSGLNTLLNNGDGTFAPTPPQPPLGGGEQVVLGDLDNDGDLDAVVRTSHAVGAMLNDGTGGFGIPRWTPVPPALAGIALGDVNRDGRTDVVAANGDLLVLLNEGGGELGEPETVALPWWLQAYWPAMGDIDGDGDVDLAVASGMMTFPSPVYVLRNDAPACCRTDWNGDGVSNSTDVSGFINDWFSDQAQGTTLTDWDANGVSNSTDVSGFINSWFEDQAAGCG